jgi:hypothetical protein
MVDDLQKFARSGDVVHRHVAGEHILVPIRGNVADMQRLYALDAVAEFVWDSLDGERCVADVARAISKKFNVDEATAQKDVGLFLDDLFKHDLIIA